MNKEIKDALEDCPFCESDRVRVVKTFVKDYLPKGANFYHVECSRGRCGARGAKRKNNRQRAVDDWNACKALEAQQGVNVEGLKRAKSPITPTSQVERHCFNEGWNKCIDHLSERGLIGGIPEGYALVPVEPTEKALEALHELILEYRFDGYGYKEVYGKTLILHYKAMIKAAQPPKAEG